MNMQYGIAAIAALTLVAGPALARPALNDDAPRQATVSYADLNLETQSGQAILKARIQHAAEAVCGPEPDSRDLAQLMPFRRCMKQSVDTAVAAMPSTHQLAEIAKPAG